MTPANASSSTDSELVPLLSQALHLAGRFGASEESSRIAAKAWWVLTKAGDETGAQRINGVMHYLARLDPEETQSMSDTELDIRQEIPMRRHELIFEAYNQLDPNTSFILINDHDPKPLYYQFEAEHTGRFTWDYLESGPEVWRVRIGRNSNA